METDESKKEHNQMLSLLLGHHEINNVTDLHIHANGQVFYRNRGVLVPSLGWPKFTDEKGKLLAPLTFNSIRIAFFTDDRDLREGRPLPAADRLQCNSRVCRSPNYQLRVQLVPSVNGHKMVIRMQKTKPPALTAILREHPETLELLTKASGLVLICGGIGAGKTTTAAAICSHWAQRRSRHVATLEDPVEYVLDKATHLEVTMPGDDLNERFLSLRQGIRVLRRSNIDGLFIGEVRDTETRDECLDFAATKEAIITTIHAGGFADALIRFTKPSSTGDQTSLRHSLSQVLSFILHVSLAYNDLGEPIPVILAINGQLPKVRSAIVDFNPKTLESNLSAALVASANQDGNISVQRACTAARKQGATIDSIKSAIPAELCPNMDWAFLSEAPSS